MKTNFKTLWTAAVLSLFCLTQASVLQADSCMDPCDPCDQECCGSFFAGVDWLYWEASETGLSYARTFEVSSKTSETGPELLELSSCSRTKNPKFNWDSGVRVFAGWRPADDCWDAAVRWTHFNNSSRGSHDNLDGTYAIPTWGGALSEVFYGNGFIAPDSQKVSGRWSLDLDLVDFELGREFNMCCCLAFRPHIGLRYAKIDQKVKTELFQTVQANASIETRGDVSMSNNFKGTGIRGGFDTNWCFSNCFGLYGNAAASLIYGRFSINQTDCSINTASVMSTQTNNYEIKQSDHLRTLAPATDLGIGIYYKSYCECATFTVKLGWEMQHFWGQNKLQRFDNKWFQKLLFQEDTAGRFWEYYAKDNSPKGNLALQGLTLSFMADF